MEQINNDGALALALAILYPEPIEPEQAYARLFGRQLKTAPVSEETTREMIRMREQGKTYMEITARFGLTQESVFGRIKRAKAKAGGCR